MYLKMFALGIGISMAGPSMAQSSHDWHYHELPNGPTAPGVHRVLGHHKQPVPIYSPQQTPETFGPRSPVRYGWFGRFTPSPRPAVRTVETRPTGSR